MSGAPICLVDLISNQQWVAWRNEERGGRWTKVPYCSATRQAEADDPATWLPHDQAALVADTIVNGSGGGLGIELGQCGEWWIAGVDLDTCRDPMSGAIEPWAITVIDRLNSYVETSPSQTGVKAFLLIDPDDVVELRRMMGTTHGRQFKRANGSSHPPSIELYISNRYFTVTWEGIPDAPTDLRVVPLKDLRWLIEEVGPAFVGKPERKHDSANSASGTNDTSASILGRLNTAAKHNRAVESALRNAATFVGGSRSEGAFGLGAALKRAGWTYEDMKAALLACPAARDWAKTADERQFERIWSRGSDTHKEETHTQTNDDTNHVECARLPSLGPTKIPPRRWAYGRFLLFGQCACLAAVDGGGKGALAVGIALSVITGRPLHSFDDGNNNVMLAKVASEMNRIAAESDVAAVVLHHLRKGSTGQVDDMMGATSVRATFRSSRVLKKMSLEEAEKLSVIDGEWRYSRIAGSKENYAPPPDKATWFRMASVSLGNGSDDYPDGDEVGVATTWECRPLFEGMDVNQLKAVFDALRITVHGPSKQAKQTPWAGRALVDIGKRSDAEAAKIIKSWIDNGVLREEEHLNEQRHKVKKVVLDDARASSILAGISVPVYPD